MVQKERKSGHWQVERLQFLKREQRGLRLRYGVRDLQPCDLQAAKLSCFLDQKRALIFQIKRPLFWKNGRICPSLVFSEKRFFRSQKSILKRKKLTVKEKNNVYQFIKDNDGFDYAKNVMLNYKNKALKILESFPDNESKQSLRILLDYIIDRKY